MDKLIGAGASWHIRFYWLNTYSMSGLPNSAFIQLVSTSTASSVSLRLFLCSFSLAPAEKIKWICLIFKCVTGNVMLMINKLGLLRVMLDYLPDSALLMERPISSCSPVHSSTEAASMGPIFGIEHLDAWSSLSGETFDCLPGCAPSSMVRIFAVNLLSWATSPH